jgi:hypothetical protein
MEYVIKYSLDYQFWKEQGRLDAVRPVLLFIFTGEKIWAIYPGKSL